MTEPLELDSAMRRVSSKGKGLPTHSQKVRASRSSRSTSTTLLVACWCIALLVLIGVSFMSPLYNKETRVKSPPAALRQSVGRPVNAFDGCAWRRPGAVLVLRVPKAASTALMDM